MQSCCYHWVVLEWSYGGREGRGREKTRCLETRAALDGSAGSACSQAHSRLAPPPHPLLLTMSGRRLYIGRLSQDATRKDVEALFGTHGSIVDVRLMAGFAFLEYEELKVSAIRCPTITS